MKQKGRLLIVDDEPIIVSLLEERLKNLDYTVHTAQTGEEALNILETEKIDILLTDVLMPGISGIELIEKAKSIQKDLQCMVITASHETEIAVEALRLGAINYFSKPINFDEVKMSVENALDKLKLMREVQDRQRELEKTNKRLEQEIVERKQVEKALRSQEEEYQTLFDNIQDGVFIIRDEVLHLVNPALCKMLGYPVEKIIGQEFTKLVASEDLSYVEGWFENYQNGRKVAGEYEIRMLHRKGYRVYVNVLVDLTNLKGEMAIIGTMKDITEKKLVEETKRKYLENLLEAKQQAESASQMKTLFLGNISHELRTPMHGVLGFAQLGMKQVEKDEQDIRKVGEYFNKIKHSGDRLLNLLNDLLDLSKLESGQMSYNMNERDLLQVIEEVVKDLKSSIQEKDLLIEVITDSPEAKGVFDYYRINQVIQNLLQNAIRFTPNKRKINIHIQKKVITSSNQSAYEVSVIDHGIGIPQNELEVVFEKFTQSSQTNDGSGGKGLGLCICREIISAHKGKIWAELNPEGGTIFKFQIPTNL